MRKITTAFILVILSMPFYSCEFEAEREQAVIVDVFEQSTVMGSAWRTTVKCKDGTMATLEGNYGSEGDTIWVKRMTSETDSSVEKIVVD